MSGGRGRGSVVGSVEDDLSVLGDFFFDFGVLFDVRNIKHVGGTGDGVCISSVKPTNFRPLSPLSTSRSTSLFSVIVFFAKEPKRIAFLTPYFSKIGVRAVFMVSMLVILMPPVLYV